MAQQGVVLGVLALAAAKCLAGGRGSCIKVLVTSQQRAHHQPAMPLLALCCTAASACAADIAIQELPDGLCACVKLEQLLLARNRLVQLPPELQCLTSITLLDLTGKLAPCSRYDSTTTTVHLAAEATATRASIALNVE